MNFKELDKIFKSISEKHEKELPVFEGENELVIWFKKLRFISNNKVFENEMELAIRKVIGNEKTPNNNDLDKIHFLLSYYKRKYESGEVSSNEINSHRLIFGSESW